MQKPGEIQSNNNVLLVPGLSEDWQNLYRQLNAAVDQAKRLAEVRLSNYGDVMARQYEQQADEKMQQRGLSLLQWQNK